MKKWNIKTKIIFFLIALIITWADQSVKHLIVGRFAEGESLPIIPSFFNLVLAYNPGVAFGVFAGIESDVIRLIVLGLTSIFALFAVYYFSNTAVGESRAGIVALSLIVGGAFGNLIDRVTLGKVVDYLDFYYGHSHYPAFNLADSSICIAVVILFLLPTPEKK